MIDFEQRPDSQAHPGKMTSSELTKTWGLRLLLFSEAPECKLLLIGLNEAKLPVVQVRYLVKVLGIRV